MTGSIRWAFNVKEWKPTKEQWKLCLQCVQKVEKERCNRFHYANDCKSSMIGQLLMRKAVSESLYVAYNKIAFARTSSGKPFLVGENENKISFNVSHNGDFCVLASELDLPIGVDVMKVEYKGKKPLPEYFNVMQKQFSASEWDFITLPGLEKEQLERFMRLWCLKESYVKAIGTGITYDLQTLSFCCKTFALKQGIVTTDTQLFKDEIQQKEWNFEETFLKASHCTAVAVETKQRKENCIRPTDCYPKCFKVITFEEVMKNCIPFEVEEENFWEIFSSKCEKD